MSVMGYEERMQDITRRAQAMKKSLLDPLRKDEGGFLPMDTPADSKNCGMILEGAIQNTPYSLSQDGPMIAGIHARALQDYERRYGRPPQDDLLASCHKAIENAMILSKPGNKPAGVFESAELSTSEGILMRDRMVSLVLPVFLQTISSQMITYIPGEFNQSEFFRIKRIAGNTFGTIQQGQEIDYSYDGLYSVMDQRVELGKGDGDKKSYTLKSLEKFGVTYPFKQKRTRVWLNRKQCAQDNGNGAIAGSYASGSVSLVISGTVDYATGEVTVNFTPAPPEGYEIYLGFDVNIERDPRLIPRIDHEMASQVLYPHEAAISGNATIQAIWGLRRELGQDIDNLTMQGLRNLLAADKDRKHLRDMLFHATDTVEWEITRPDALTLKQHYETLNAALLEVDTRLMKNNGISGLVGIVAGSQATNIYRYLPDPYFVAAPGFRSIAQPHYVGRVFGTWDLYCNPQMEPMTNLCFGRGPDHGQTAYVAGDAVPALTFKHPIMGDLTQRSTMWELAYRDMQPFDGEKYLCKLMFTEKQA